MMVCALVVGGCAQFDVNPPRIDPTGERIFAEPLVSAEPVYREVPGSFSTSDRVSVVVCPSETVAPVASEVVVLAGVLGADNYLWTNERVEWMVEPGGVGEFVDLGKGTLMDLLVWDFTRPRKIDNTFAVGSTSRRHLRLTRGTPSQEDDVLVQRGQAWITVTSPWEGTSRVTAYAPNVGDWQCRRQTATIHWVDAQWSFPPPSINPAGTRHVFTTSVTRQSDGSPCAGWRVRYEILDGPAAGFAPDGAAAIEVATDDLGQASAEIFQQQPAAGTNRIGIQVIRPAELGGGRRLVIGSGATLKTWSAADIAVRKTGPAVGSVGATLTYRIDVSNPGDLPAEEVTLADVVPDGLTYLRSNPAGELQGGSVRWRLGTLAAKQTRSVEIDFRADRQGSVTNCAEAAASGGLQARDCATTTVSTPSVEVQVVGSQQEVPVGQDVTFTIVVTNRGQVPAGGLLIKDRFDPGLEHAQAQSPIEKDLGIVLAPGQSQQVGVVLRVTRAGRLCNTVEVIGDGQILATATACVNAVEATRPQAQPEPKPRPIEPELRPTTLVSMSVAMTGPQVATVGEDFLFTIEVANTGERSLSGVKVSTSLDATLTPVEASELHFREGDEIVWSVDALPAGTRRRFQVKCTCGQAALAAWARVRVTSREGAQGEDQASVRIEAAPTRTPPRLTMSIAALREPVALDKEFTYLIRVNNEGQTADHQVSLVVTLPPELQLVKFRTHGPPNTDFLPPDGQVIRFLPLESIEPALEKPLEYRIRVRAVRVGMLRVQAELTSEHHRDPVTESVTTTIFAQ